MAYDRETDTYIPEFEERLKVITFEPNKTPGINIPQIDEEISVDQVQLTAADITFDPTGTGMTSTNVQDAIVEARNYNPGP